MCAGRDEGQQGGCLKSHVSKGKVIHQLATAPTHTHLQHLPLCPQLIVCVSYRQRQQHRPHCLRRHGHDTQLAPLGCERGVAQDSLQIMWV